MNGGRMWSLSARSRGTWARAASALVVAVTVGFSILNAANGDLDLSFGDNGKVMTDVYNAGLNGTAVAVDARGRIVVGGYFVSERLDDMSGLALLRYNEDGTMDTTFGTEGMVRGPDGADGIAIDRNGKILVVSSYSQLSRYNEDGTLDLTFSNGGIARTPCGGSAVAIDAAGKVIVAGSVSGAFCLARYDEAGALDNTFGTAGVVVTALNGGATAMALDRDGKIAVAGLLYTGDGYFHTALARFNDSGSLDEGFGASGVVLGNFGTRDYAQGVSIDSEGRVVVVGQAIRDHSHLFAARYTANGAPDVDFNGSGQIVTDLSQDGFVSFASARSVAVDGHDRIIVLNQIEDESGMDMLVWRLTPDGTFDTSFGVGGMTRTDFAPEDQAGAVALDTEGRIIVVGTAGAGVPWGNDLALARYEAGSSRYTFTGFFAPIDNAPVFNVIKAGRTVPLKFSLDGNQGLDVLAAGSPASHPIACQSSAGIEVIQEAPTAATSNLSYDPTTAQYTYAWKTDKAWANTCRQLVLTLNDGSEHVVNFQFAR